MECTVHISVGFGVRGHKPGVGSVHCSACAVWLTAKLLGAQGIPAVLHLLNMHSTSMMDHTYP